MTEFATKRTADINASQKLDTVEARQAVAPHRLRYMLVFGTVGAIVALGAICLLFLAG
ncbi:hypothetical protein [Kaistia algarum]|uniref:hypothetical protein n=1 Tax=Kaistia algarum TaxID=2083279 RepID=UPI001401D253|nr:hypothetical protein [Kaistia algarum]MCX5513706.1 hypothetical protein [Kaistia algarum]